MNLSLGKGRNKYEYHVLCLVRSYTRLGHILECKKMKINYEKVGIYLACIGFVYMFWQGQNSDKVILFDIKERLAKLEVKVEHLEKD